MVTLNQHKDLARFDLAEESPLAVQMLLKSAGRFEEAAEVRRRAFHTNSCWKLFLIGREYGLHYI